MTEVGPDSQMVQMASKMTTQMTSKMTSNRQPRKHALNEGCVCTVNYKGKRIKIKRLKKNTKNQKIDTHHYHAKRQFQEKIDRCIGRFACKPRLHCKLPGQIRKTSKLTYSKEGTGAKARSLAAKVNQKRSTTTKDRLSR